MKIVSSLLSFVVVTLTFASLSWAEAPAPDKIGVVECDDFLTKYEACLSSKVPEASRAALKQSLDQTRTSWKQAAANEQTKGTLATACKQATDSAKQTTAAFGCTW